MANEYSYEIGTTSSTTNVEALTTPLNPPRADYVEWPVTYDRADGSSVGDGFPVVTWTFDVLTQAMVTQLRTFCSGRSASIYIKTRKPDGTFVKYSCEMIWPADQLARRNFGGKYLDIQFQFRKLEAA